MIPLARTIFVLSVVQPFLLMKCQDVLVVHSEQYGIETPTAIDLGKDLVPVKLVEVGEICPDHNNRLMARLDVRDIEV